MSWCRIWNKSCMKRKIKAPMAEWRIPPRKWKSNWRKWPCSIVNTLMLWMNSMRQRNEQIELWRSNSRCWRRKWTAKWSQLKRSRQSCLNWWISSSWQTSSTESTCYSKSTECASRKRMPCSARMRKCLQKMTVIRRRYASILKSNLKRQRLTTHRRHLHHQMNKDSREI